MSVVFKPEADLHADLIVRDVAALKLAADLRDLEPVLVPDGLAGPMQGVANRRVNPVGRCANDVGHPLGVVGHDASERS